MADPWGNTSERFEEGKARKARYPGWAELTPDSVDGHVPVSLGQWQQVLRTVVFEEKSALTVALLLATFANNDGTGIRPSQETLARALTYGENPPAATRTVRAGLRNLTSTGFLRLVSAGSNLGVRAAASEYRLTVPAWVWELQASGKWDVRDEAQRRPGGDYLPAPMWCQDGTAWVEPAPRPRQQKKGAAPSTGSGEPHPTTGSGEPQVEDQRKHSADHRKPSVTPSETTGSAAHDHRSPTSTYPHPEPSPQVRTLSTNTPAAVASQGDVQTAPAHDADGIDDAETAYPSHLEALDPGEEYDVPPEARALMEADGMTDPVMQRVTWATLMKECGTGAAALARLRVPPPPGDPRDETEGELSDAAGYDASEVPF